MTYFTVHGAGLLRVPVVAHLPHNSTFIPDEVRSHIVLSDDALEREMTLMTDLYTRELYQRILDVGGGAIESGVNRLVFDPERFEDDAQEPMTAKGMSVVYTKTSDQRVLRNPLTPERRTWYLDTFYRPYHAALTGLVEMVVEKFGRCLVIDCHSFPSKPLPYEFDQESFRPDICIGTDRFHTPVPMVQALVSSCKRSALSIELDRPFSGALVPMRYYGVDKRVSAVMIELNRGRYLIEGTRERSHEFASFKGAVDGLIDDVVAAYSSDS